MAGAANVSAEKCNALSQAIINIREETETKFVKPAMSAAEECGFEGDLKKEVVEAGAAMGDMLHSIIEKYNPVSESLDNVASDVDGFISAGKSSFKSLISNLNETRGEKIEARGKRFK